MPGSQDETAQMVRSAGAIVIPMDLTDRHSVGAFIWQVLNSGAPIKLIVHDGRYFGPGIMDTLMDNQP